jgi:cyclase
VQDVREILLSGADKVAINTAALRRPGLVNEVAETFGSQCMVLSVEAKRVGVGKWEALCNNGREPTGLDVVEWVCEGEARGAGEILVTSVDQEGTGRGFDVDLIGAVAGRVKVPVIAAGGMGSVEHLRIVVEGADVSAVAVAHALHYNKVTLDHLRQYTAGLSWGLRPAPGVVRI